MSEFQLILLAASVLVGAFIQGTTGVGFALIVAPAVGLLRPDLLPVVVLLLMVPLNVYVAWRERGALDWIGTRWITAGRIAGTAGGVWVLVLLSTRQLNLFVGLSTIAAVLVTLGAPTFTPTRIAFVGAGFITGVTETATSVGGPPLALAYQHQPAATMRSTLALCFLIGQVISLATLTYAGRVSSSQWVAAVSLAPPLAIGALLSHFVHARINARSLRIFVLVFALASGVALSIRAL